MEAKTLGEKIRELRLAAGMSLRQLARTVHRSPPFISDVELGRRFPSDEVLRAIAEELAVDFNELKQYDTRESVSRLRRLAETDARWGLALRTTADQAKSGDLTPDELLRRLGASRARPSR